jgi:DNA-binding response OmpR family regulator
MDFIEVRLIRWPSRDDQRDESAAAYVPRLLLVDAGEPPPAVTDPLEDWIRSPADPVELQARIMSLRRAASQHLRLPRLDEDGILRRGAAWLALGPTQAVLLRVLLEHPDAVVSTERLTRRTWPQGPPSKTAVHDRITRLAPRLRALGLRVHRVRGRGYLLEVSELAM